LNFGTDVQSDNDSDEFISFFHTSSIYILLSYKIIRISRFTLTFSLIVQD